LKGFSQLVYEDTYQADSIYKKNKVKSRLMYHLNDRISIADYYDKDGRLITNMHLTKQGEAISRSTFTYDSAGLLLKEDYISFLSADTTGKNKGAKDRTDTLNKLTTRIIYDTNGRLARKIKANAKGLRRYEVFFSYDPLKKTERYFNSKDSSYQEYITDYEKPFIVKKGLGYQVNGNEKKIISDYSISNYFDGSGRITRRLIKRKKAADQDAFDSIEEKYQYNKQGLLERKTETTLSNKTIKRKELLIEYQYW